MLNAWKTKPILQRKTKPIGLDEFYQLNQELRTSRYSEIAEGGHNIFKLLRESNRALHISTGAPEWRAYIDFVNNVVIEGLSEAVSNSLYYLLKQIDAEELDKSDTMSMLEIELDMYGKEVVFVPSIGDEEEKHTTKSKESESKPIKSKRAERRQSTRALLKSSRTIYSKNKNLETVEEKASHRTIRDTVQEWMESFLKASYQLLYFYCHCRFYSLSFLYIFFISFFMSFFSFQFDPIS